MLQTVRCKSNFVHVRTEYPYFFLMDAIPSCFNIGITYLRQKHNKSLKYQLYFILVQLAMHLLNTHTVNYICTHKGGQLK